MPIISVLVAFLVFLCNSTVPDGVLPENANAVAQFNASGFQAPHAAVGRTRLLSRFGVPTAAWGTLVRVEPGGDAPSTQPYCTGSVSSNATALQQQWLEEYSFSGVVALGDGVYRPGIMQEVCNAVGLGSVHHHEVCYPNDGSYGLIYPAPSTGDNALGSTHNHKPSPLPTITLLNSSDFKGGVEAKFCHYMYSGEYNVVSGSHGNCTHRNSTSDDVESR